jgi:hypothetical protein
MYTNLSPSAKAVLDAYGGAERWQNARRIEAIVSAKGLAFRLKRRPFFEKVKIEMAVDQAFSKLTTYRQKT